MQNLGKPDLLSPLSVALNDAGAANLIIAWLRKRLDLDVRVCASGAALGLWKSAFGSSAITTLDVAISGSAMLLSGTSYDGNLEHKARLLARNQGIRSVGVIDHWVNYRNRFTWNGVTCIPNEIWVTDSYALQIAESIFGANKVVLMPNRYLDSIICEIRNIKVPRKAKEIINVLYLMEPLRGSWVPNGAEGEFIAFDFFMNKIISQKKDLHFAIKIRPHPSDVSGKYYKLIKNYNLFEIEIDSSTNLAEAIACADVVVGGETYAMVVALHAGKKVYSSLPHFAHRCRLPHEGIKHLSMISGNLSFSNGTNL